MPPLFFQAFLPAFLNLWALPLWLCVSCGGPPLADNTQTTRKGKALQNSGTPSSSLWGDEETEDVWIPKLDPEALANTSWQVMAAFCHETPLSPSMNRADWLFQRNLTDTLIFGQLVSYAVPGLVGLLEKVGTMSQSTFEQKLISLLPEAPQADLTRLAWQNILTMAQTQTTQAGGWDALYEDLGKKYRHTTPSHFQASFPVRFFLSEQPALIQWKIPTGIQPPFVYVSQKFSFFGYSGQLIETKRTRFFENPYADRPLPGVNPKPSSSLSSPTRFSLAHCPEEPADLCVTLPNSTDPFCPEGTLRFELQKNTR